MWTELRFGKLSKDFTWWKKSTWFFYAFFPTFVIKHLDSLTNICVSICIYMTGYYCYSHLTGGHTVREISQIVIVMAGIGKPTTQSWLSLSVSLYWELSPTVPILRYLSPLWFPWTSLTSLFFPSSVSYSFLCLFLPRGHLRMPAGQSRRESSFWDALSTVSVCLSVIHLLLHGSPPAPPPHPLQIPCHSPTASLCSWNPKMGGLVIECQRK